MSPTLYILLWMVYLIAGLLLMWMIWMHTRWQRLLWLGRLSRLIIFILVFTPAKLYHETEYLVPATISLAFDSLLGHDEAAFATTVNLIVSAIVCTLVFIIYYVILQIVHSRRAK